MRKKQSQRSTTIVKQDIIDDIVADFDDKYTHKEIEDVLNSFWNICTYYLKSSTPDNPILVKPFFGLQLTSSIVKSEERKALGTTFYCSNRRRVAAKLTRYFTRTTMNDLRA